MDVSGIVTAVAGVAVAYTYAGYGALVWLLGSVRSKKVQRGAWTGSVSVLLVVRNGEELVEARLRNLLTQKDVGAAYEIVVVSDGSTDGTLEKIQSVEDSRIRLVSFPDQRGKATVFNEVVPQCNGEVIVFADARQEFAENAVAELCANLCDPEVGAVSGELMLRRKAGEQGIGGGLAAYWNIEKMIRKAESRLDSVVGCTGAIYAIRKECFEPLHKDTVLDDVAIPMLMAMKGRRVVFEPNAVAWDDVVEEVSKESARKVRTLAGNIQLCALYPDLFNPFRNRLFIQFVSHKLLRLFSPWMLMLLFGATVMSITDYEIPDWIVTVQALFYVIAALGILMKRLPLGILKLPASFLLLNIWAARAPFHYWSGKLSAKWR